MKSHPLLVGSTLVLALALVVPFLTLGLSTAGFSPEIWGHLASTRLPELLFNTLRLALGVGAGTLVLGTGLGWMVSFYEFRGRAFLEWALILPMAIPAYVIGFVFLASFEYQGLVGQVLEGVLGIQGFSLDLRHYGGVVLVMTLVLYPYVYLMALSAFRQQSPSLLEAARIQGLNSRQAFFRVTLPLARPSLFAGLSLVLMESLADFGTVAIFSFDTFTTAIYDIWFGMFERKVAAQLACLLLVFNLLLFALEQKTRGQAKYYQTKAPTSQIRKKAQGAKAWVLPLVGGGVFFLAFLFPLANLVTWALSQANRQKAEKFWELTSNSLILGVGSALVILPVALFFAYGKRRVPGRLLSWVTRLSSMGYALPGTVIAVGVLIPLAWLDHRINGLTEAWWGWTPGLIFTGSIAGLMFAYVVRFLTLGFNAADAALGRITPSMDMAARSLGKNGWGLFRLVHLPLMRPSLMIAVIMILVDVMKEMPATLLMRPFGFDTLATWIWQLTSEALAQEAALPALAIVLVGLLPVILLIRFSHRQT